MPRRPRAPRPAPRRGETRKTECPECRMPVAPRISCQRRGRLLRRVGLAVALAVELRTSSRRRSRCRRTGILGRESVRDIRGLGPGEQQHVLGGWQVGAPRRRRPRRSRHPRRRRGDWVSGSIPACRSSIRRAGEVEARQTRMSTTVSSKDDFLPSPARSRHHRHRARRHRSSPATRGASSSSPTRSRASGCASGSPPTSADESKSFWRAETVEVLDASPHRRPHIWARGRRRRGPGGAPGRRRPRSHRARAPARR